MSQSIYANSNTSKEKLWELAQARYDEYQSNASLMITSRLHVTIPCLAMDIPTILVRDSHGYTFSWVNRFTPINLRGGYEDIKWEPDICNLEEIKRLVLINDIKAIKGDNISDSSNAITMYYEKREQRIRTYEECQKICWEDIVDDLHKHFSSEKDVTYSFWGINATTFSIYDYIKSNYPNAILTNIYDRDYKLNFADKISNPPSNITIDSEELVIVVPVSAVETAKIYFDKIGRKPETYIFVSDLMMRPD